ncbi:hypothetical protein SteCoe_11221 [Stentor coeruleus]|uniref:Uncharacterized protein n=1 Tax=Stentor coeruleus TaxID=5963 RepID=A0A1R2CDU5_9CILI|nr:hypothetical protein SteCoe_11221 [Stentor coeruleus]
MAKLRVIHADYHPSFTYQNLSLILKTTSSASISINDSAFSLPQNSDFKLVLNTTSTELGQSPLLSSYLFSYNSQLCVPLFDSSSELLGKILIRNDDFEDFQDINHIENLQKSNLLLQNLPGKTSGILAEKKFFGEFKQGKFTLQEIAKEINGELKNSLEKSRKMLEAEKKAKESLVERNLNLKAELAREKEESKKREQNIFNDLQTAEDTISNMKFDILKVKTESKALQAENTRLQDENKHKAQAYKLQSEQFNDLKNEFENAFPTSSYLLQIIDDLTGKSEIPLKSQLETKDKKINELTQELNNIKALNKSLFLRQNMNKSDEIEALIEQKTKEFKILGKFVKDQEQGYIFNNKKVIMLVKSGQLLCKNGTVYKPFEEFMESIGGIASERKSLSHKRIKSNECEKRRSSWKIGRTGLQVN